MKKRTRFISTRNYTLLKMKQLMKSLRHSLRISTTLSMNINQERIKYNKVEMLDIRNFMNNNEENYISLNYELNKLQTDLTYILEFKNVVTIDEITKILNKGNELLREIKNIKISPNQVELIRYMLSNAKKIEIEKSNKIYDNDNNILNDEDISTNQKEEKKLSKKTRIKKAREEIYQLQKEQLLEDINLLDDEQKNKLLFEMEQLENIENMIKLMTKENIKDDEKPQDLVKLRESIKSTKKALEDKKMNMSLENFDKFYDENIEDKTDEEIATEYINQNWDNTKYKENMNEGFKKRTIESLIKYTTIKDKKRNMNKDEIVSGTKTIVQELMFKPITGGIKMTIEELTELQNKIKEEEKAKGNFVFASMIHDDESRPHIHIFIMSKSMNILNNQVNFINEKYQTTFNPYNLMKKEEQKRFGVKQQDHYYELINSVITQDKKFVRKHIVDTTQIDLIKDEKMKQEAIEQKDLIRKSNNLLIKARNRESINKREFNNINNDIEKNIEKFEMINLEFIDKENKLENRKTKYQKELQREKQKMQQDYEDMKSKLQNKFNEQLQSKKQELEKENQEKLEQLKTEQTKKVEEELKLRKEQLEEKTNKLKKLDRQLEEKRKQKDDYEKFIKPLSDDYKSLVVVVGDILRGNENSPLKMLDTLYRKIQSIMKEANIVDEIPTADEYVEQMLEAIVKPK